MKKTEKALKHNKTKSSKIDVNDNSKLEENPEKKEEEEEEEEEEKKKISFFQKIKMPFESNIINYLVTIIIIIIALFKLIYTLPKMLNTIYYRSSFYSQWIDGLVILTQFGFLMAQIIFSRFYNLCQLYAIIFLGFVMICYAIYAAIHAYVIRSFSKIMYIDCMNNLIFRGETKAFENNYNYRCDTFIKDCVSFYEEQLDCPIILMQDKMENIIINRKMFLCQVIMILILIIAYHIKIANFLKYSNDMAFFKKLKNQDSMKWYHDVLFDKEKEINTMKRDINISLNQINSYIKYDENENKIMKTNYEGKDVNIDDDNTTKINTTSNNSQQILSQSTLTDTMDHYNNAVYPESRSVVNINIEFNNDGNVNITKETN